MIIIFTISSSKGMQKAEKRETEIENVYHSILPSLLFLFLLVLFDDHIDVYIQQRCYEIALLILSSTASINTTALFQYYA